MSKNQQTEFNNSHQTEEHKIFSKFSPERQLKHPNFLQQTKEKQNSILQQLNEELNNQYINFISETPHFSAETKQMCISWFTKEKCIKLKETALKNLLDHIDLESQLAKIYFNFPDIILEQATQENPHFKKSFYSCTFEEKEHRIKILKFYYKTWQIHQPAIQKSIKQILQLLDKSNEFHKFLLKSEIQEIKSVIPKLLTQQQAENLLTHLQKLLESKQAKSKTTPSIQTLNKQNIKKNSISNNSNQKSLKSLQSLASIHEAQNEYQKAISDYEQILKLSPNQPGIKSKLQKVKSVINTKAKSKNRERELKFLSKRINHFLTIDSTLKNLFTKTRLLQKITPTKEQQEKSSNNSSTKKLLIKETNQNQFELFITQSSTDKKTTNQNPNQPKLQKLNSPTDLPHSKIWQNYNIEIQTQENQPLSATQTKQHLHNITQKTTNQIFKKISNHPNQLTELTRTETKQQIIKALH